MNRSNTQQGFRLGGFFILGGRDYYAHLNQQQIWILTHLTNQYQANMEVFKQHKIVINAPVGIPTSNF